MPNVDLLVAFLVATSVFAYMPGPSTLYATAQTLALGRRGGLFAALGIHVGGYVHVIAAAAGLAALIDIVPLVHTIMKLAGACYLVWLGLQLILSQEPLVVDSESASQKTTFWQSATVEILNPKTALFYVAFLPQFTEVGAALPLWAQLLLLGTIVNLMFSSADLICVFLAEKLSLMFKNAGSSASSISSAKTVNRIGGGILIALGVNLAASR